LDEFCAVLAREPWDLALLQEAPPRWLRPLCARTAAHGASALTSRNLGAALRGRLAEWNPDLIASNEGGSNQLLVRAPARIGEVRRLTLARRPERRRMLFARVELAGGGRLAVANLHATAGRPDAAAREIVKAAECAVGWAGDDPLVLGGDLNARQRKVPQLFVATGASAWGADIQAHPWTIGWQPNYVTEAKVYADFLEKEKPNAKVAALYQNDGFGKDLLGGFEAALKGTDIQLVAKESYEVTDPTITTQMRTLAGSGADTFINITTPKFSAQAIAAIAKSDWKPLHILNNVGASKTLVLTPVGLENAKGIISTQYYKDPEDPQWADDAAMTEYKENLKKFAPRADPNEPFHAFGWAAASTMVKALEGMKEPTRQSLMDSVRNLDTEIPLLLPGVKVQTSPEDGYPIEAMQIMEFNGKNWELQGDVVEAPAQ